MRRIPSLVGTRNITKHKLVETSVPRHTRVGGVNGHKNDPRDEPYGEKDPDDHAEKSNKEICVEAICICNELVIGSYDGQRPSEESVSQGLCLGAAQTGSGKNIVRGRRQTYPAVGIYVLGW